MIEHKIEHKLFDLYDVVRYPNDITLILQGPDTVGQITFKNEIEKNLWKEAIKKINETLQALNKS